MPITDDLTGETKSENKSKAETIQECRRTFLKNTFRSKRESDS